MEEAEFEFTESDSTIRFERDEGDVFVSANYAPRRAVVKLEPLGRRGSGVPDAGPNHLLMAHPALRLNVTVRRLLEGSAWVRCRRARGHARASIAAVAGREVRERARCFTHRASRW